MTHIRDPKSEEFMTQDRLTEALSVSDTARRLGVSAQTIINLANKGTLQCIRTRLGRLFMMDDVEAIAKARSASRS